MDNNNSEQLIKTEEQQTQPKKKTKKKLIILSVILLLLLFIVGVIVYTVGYHTPDTGIDQPPPFATDGLIETDKDPSDSKEPETEAVDPSLLPRSQQKIYNFLLIGQDRVALNTDVMMIINFNTSTKKISVIQIPRDTYIELDNYSGKINGLYAHYYLRNDRDIKTGARKLADTLEKNLCIKIHNVIHINLDGVQKIVDALGGVDLNLPNDFTYRDTRVKKTITLPAGKNHFDGYMAEQFIRKRSTYVQADIGRIDAQKIFMSGLLQRAKSSLKISTISQMAEIVFENVNTDIKLSDGIFYAKNLLNVDMNNINFMSMIGRNASGNGLSFYVMVRKNMQEMIDKYFNIYDFSITDAIFDANRVFTSTKKFPHFNALYTITDIDTNDPYSADDINDNSIDIPQVRKGN